jgi:hypothetical protein
VRKHRHEFVVPAVFHAKFFSVRQKRPSVKGVRALPGAALEHLSGAEVDAMVGNLVVDVAPVAVVDARVAITS